MNKLSFQLCALACALGLAACGSGGTAAPEMLQLKSANTTGKAQKAPAQQAAAEKAKAAETEKEKTKADAADKTDKTSADVSTAKKAETKSVGKVTNQPVSKTENQTKPVTKTENKKDQTAEEKAKADKFSDELKKILPPGEYLAYQNDFISIKKDGSIKAGQTTNKESSADYDKFSINGVKIVLTQNDALPHQFVSGDFINPQDFNAKQPGWVAWTDEFKKTSFGVYTDNEGTDHLFINGTPDSEQRVSENQKTNAYYLGSAVFGKDGKYEGLNNALSANVNFVNKTIDFVLDKGNDKLEFGANIKGIHFQSADTPKNGIETRGGFFGYGDIAGMLNVRPESKYEQYRGYRGVFGAVEKRRR